MKLNKLQKKIMLFLLVLCFLTPMGILLPMFVNAGNAWGEWSAQTLKDLIGYVPQGLAKYEALWNAPLPDYAVNVHNASIVHQSGYYLVSGILGATATFVIMMALGKILVRNGK
jgi:cobalt/nickel transport protein